MKNSMSKMMLSCFAVLALSACSSPGSGPSPQHYVLDAIPNINKPADFIVSARVSSQPDYLNQSNLVMLVSEHKMQIAQYHNWANRVSDSVARIVEDEVNVALSERGFNAQNVCSNCYRIDIKIEHFYPTIDGDVYLKGNYQFLNGDGEMVKQSFGFKGTMAQSGYQSAVLEMRALLSELSAQIVKDII